MKRVVPVLNHGVWTALVGLVLSTYIQSEDGKHSSKILIPYLVPVVAHMLWNYHGVLVDIGRRDVIFAVIPWIISITGIAVAWRTEIEF